MQQASRRTRLGRAALALLALVPPTLVVTASPAHAAGITVTTTSDEAPADADNGQCSLREAIAATNLNGAVDSCAAGEAANLDTITVPAGSYPIGTNLQISNAGPVKIVGSGPGLTILDGGGADRIFTVAANAAAEISGVTIQNGLATSGGGISVENNAALTVSDSVLSNNTANCATAGTCEGGAIAVSNGAKLAVIGSTLSSNKVVCDTGTCVGAGGGGISNFDGTINIENSTLSGNEAVGSCLGASCSALGGGLRNAGGTVTITGSTLSGNVAKILGCANGGCVAGGGAIRLNGDFDDTVTITNSTLSGNSALLELPSCASFCIAAGGAIDRNGGAASITASTLSGNTATCRLTVSNSFCTAQFGGINGSTFGSDGMGNPDPGIPTSQTIIAGSTVNGFVTGNCGGKVFGGFNLSSDSTCTLFVPANSLSSVDPLLGPLRDNGGPTFTHVLAGNSPAIDAGGDCNPPITTDQRGAARPAGALCDIGAYEAARLLTVDPPTATNIVGDVHSITATVADPDGTALPGITVNFVVAGANPGAGACVGTCVSDGDGQVTFQYTGTNVGDDTITASVADAFGVEVTLAVTVEKTWRLPTTVNTVIHDETHTVVTSVPEGTEVHDLATVVGNGIDTPTGAVVFTFFGNGTCTVPGTVLPAVALDGSAMAESPVQGPLAPGSSSFRAHYNGDALYAPADGPCEALTVTREDDGSSGNPGLVADLAAGKSGPTSTVLGVPFTYALTATNNGPDMAINVTVTDVLPAGVVFVSASPGCAHSAGTVTCSTPFLNNGASAGFTVVVRPVEAGAVSNTAHVSATTSDPNPANDTSAPVVTTVGSSSRGRITIIEDSGNGVGPLATAGNVTFGFHTKGLKTAKFRLADDATRVFEDLKAGTYTIAQDKKDGWRLDKIVCMDPSHNTKVKLDTRRAVIKVKAGETVVCSFTNKKK